MKIMGWFKRWGVLCFSAVLMGCATTEDAQILDERIYQLQIQLNTFKKEEEALKKELYFLQNEFQSDISTIKKEQKSFEQEAKMNISTLEKGNSLLRTEFATETKKFQTDLLLRFETLQSEIKTLSADIEEYKDFLIRTSKETDRIKEEISLLIKPLEEKGKTIEERNKTQDARTKVLEERVTAIDDHVKGLEEGIKGLGKKINELVLKQTEIEKSIQTREIPLEIKGEISIRVGDLYKDAFETFHKGDLQEACRKFEAFVKQYPNTALSDNAQFFIGETYYLQKDFENSILEYEKAIMKYPEGDKIPEALFKQALAFLELGDKNNAKNLLKRVIARYPNSNQMEMAKKKLEEIE